MQRDLPPLGCLIHQKKDVANLLDLQRCILNSRLGQKLAGIEQAGKIKASAGGEVPASLPGQLLLAADPLSIRRWRKNANTRLAQRRADVGGEQVPELIKFQNARGGMFEG